MDEGDPSKTCVEVVDTRRKGYIANAPEAPPKGQWYGDIFELHALTALPECDRDGSTWGQKCETYKAEMDMIKEAMSKLVAVEGDGLGFEERKITKEIQNHSDSCGNMPKH
jgi:hypothetical protein